MSLPDAVALACLHICTAQVETIYKAEHGELELNLAEADEAVTRFDMDLEKVCFPASKWLYPAWGVTGAILTTPQHPAGGA